ncbi:hypothetical protein G6F24_005111 [Rhizopus arrhizus]|nr:hypothetical protein G6F24_005111 [Rhizopus arrhizus]
MNTHLPITNWLSKLTSLPFGRTRWISRFFVLLDNEIYVYKDELVERPLQILSLNQARKVFSISIQGHPYCLQLERTKEDKPWIIQCQSELEMNKWIDAIQYRLLNLYPKCKTESIVCIDESSISADIYRLPTQPFRCMNVTNELTLLQRRNKQLAPINTQQQESQQITVSPVSSTCTLIPSPTGAVIGAPDYHKQLMKKQLIIISPPLIKQKNYSNQEDDELSPTYLIYKSKFNLHQ